MNHERVFMLNKIKSAIAKQLSLDVSEVHDDSLIIDDLGADSLDAVELLMELEDQFGVSIPDEDVSELKTVLDIDHYIELKRNENRGNL
ncbi:MAG TPA: acyl carrier protein [Clostridiales bacterium]|jgi:acyl carrier protein|nr:acyl carrier protein [Clostridiales bacterium]HBE12853.1 acyl carrier protein [Clostridiales bacterium]HBK30495.1 acyl carrier protein [Porphyromonadaceae bacterium]HCG36634.1 acyl carrier protein [Clostridiales bacterium]